MSAFSGAGTAFAQEPAEWDEPVLTNRLTILKNAGITRIRVNVASWDTETVNVTWRNQLRNVCATALTLGFDVVEWGYTNNGLADLTNTTMTGGYHDALMSTATWAQTLPQAANFVLCLGNEDDGRVDGVTVTTAQYQAYVRGTLATDAKARLTSGKVSYACHTGNYAQWIAGGAGSLDKIGLNLYDVKSTFIAQSKVWKNAFPTIGYLAEWNTNGGYTDYNDDLQFAGDIQARRDAIIPQGFENYFFGFTFSAANQTWALLTTDGSYRKAWAVITNKRRFLVP